MTTELPDTHPSQPATAPLALKSNEGLGAGDGALEQWRAKLWELIDSYRSGAGGWPVACRDRLKRHIAEMPVAECMEMALCERHKLVLRVGQPYVFAPVGDCESCAEALARAREAYGPSAGAPNVRGNRETPHDQA
jgi:hypothetical protein